MKSRHFNIIELLIIFVIIAILAALLLPVLMKTKEKTRRIVCMNNLRQCGVASVLYAKDNNGILNPTTGPHGTVQSLYWFGRITIERFKPYFDTWKITDCPSWEGKPTLGSGYPSQMRGSNMTGFIYSGGLDTTKLRPGAGDWWTSPKAMNDDPELMLWADRIVTSVRYTGKYPHTSSGWHEAPRRPWQYNPDEFGNEGGNVFNLDGSAKWVSQKIMTAQKADSVARRVVNWWRVEAD